MIWEGQPGKWMSSGQGSLDSGLINCGPWAEVDDYVGKLARHTTVSEQTARSKTESMLTCTIKQNC